MSQGKVVQIIGAVVDIEFPQDNVPRVYDALRVTEGDLAGLTLEVQQQLGGGIVRGIALGTTDGLRRGLPSRCCTGFGGGRRARGRTRTRCRAPAF